MADYNRLAGNWYFDGTVEGKTLIPSDNSITNTKIPAGAKLDPMKLRHRPTPRHEQPNTATTAETRVLHVAQGLGIVLRVMCGSIVKAVGDSTVSIDVLKNGTTILTAPKTLNNANANYTPVDAIISVTVYAKNDVFTVTITPTAGTGTLPTGVYVEMVTDEDAQ